MHWSWLVLAAIVGIATVFIYVEARGMTFIRDDWNMILTRRGHSLEVFLRPHNGHLLPLHVLAYKVLLETFGLRTYVPYQALALALHGLVVTLLFVYARSRVGPLVALAVAAVFAIPGAAVHDVLWPFQIGFLTSAASGLGMLLALERGDRRGDVAASALLLVSIASSAVGFAFVAAAIVELVASRTGARRALRVMAVPLGLFAIWYLAYAGEVPPGTVPATEGDLPPAGADNLFDAPRYLFDAAGAALATATGLGPLGGQVLAAAALVLVGLRLVRGPAPSPRLRAVLALALSYWALLGLARAHHTDPAAVRYLYPGVLFILLIGVEWIRGRDLSRRARPLLAVATAVILLVNIGQVRFEADALLAGATDILPRLTALELSRGTVDPGFRPSEAPGGSAPDVVAGAYFAAIDDFGSPAPSLAELQRSADFPRLVADTILLRALGVQLRPGGDAPTGARCQTLRPFTGAETLDVEVPPAGLTLKAETGPPIALSARRLADIFGPPFATLAGGRTALLAIPGDRAGRPWQLRLAAGQSVRACNR